MKLQYPCLKHDTILQAYIQDKHKEYSGIFKGKHQGTREIVFQINALVLQEKRKKFNSKIRCSTGKDLERNFTRILLFISINASFV